MIIKNSKQYFSRLFLIIAALALIILSGSTQTAQAASVNVTLDGASAGRTFYGVGGLSGGGGTSRLLWDYPTQQQSEILDYLFKPNYGASLQILKVEIGGDGNSTNGAEASHERTATDQNYHRGYEWWLMQQAKARNPNIKFYGLEWAAPGWFNGSAGGASGFWSTDNVNYIVNWIKNAQSVYGFTINYVGGWNETGYNKAWLEQLHAAIKNAGLSTLVVADDSAASKGWAVATDMKGDSTFNAAVDIVGEHYPSTSTSDAQGLGKPLFASEAGSVNYNTGAAGIAQHLNQNYINGKIAAYINWSAVAAWYSTLPFYGDGLMLADQPWNGHYVVGEDIWAIAHTTQFTQIGWHYLDSGSALISGGGSYVAYKSTNNSDYSVVIQGVGSATTLNFTVKGGLSTGVVHVWSSNLSSSSSSNWFVKDSDITPSGGTYSFTAQPGFVYSLTTTSGQSKGAATPPASATMTLPYSDNFESYTVGAMPNLPKYFSALEGAFEAENCINGHTGKCIQQEIPAAPIPWHGAVPEPIMVMGDVNWTNYTTTIDAMLPQSGYVDLIGRWQSYSRNTGGVSGYILRVNSSGSWNLFSMNSANTVNITTNPPTSGVLASGSVSFPLNSWHTLGLTFSGTSIKALYDGSTIASVTDSTYGNGQVGLGSSQWKATQFDNFSITTGSGGSTTTYDDASSSFIYTGSGWSHGNCKGSDNCYAGTNSWDHTTNDYVSLSFTGTQAKLYGLTETNNGYGAVSIDGGSETNVDFYGAKRAGDILMWTSPTLTKGAHTLKLRVTGTHDSSSTGSIIVLDRVDVLP